MMKTGIAVFCVLLAVTVSGAPFNFARQSFFSNERMAMVDQINSDNTLSWKATYDNKFANSTFGDIQMLMGTMEDKFEHPDLEFVEHSPMDLPENFDAREQWPEYIGAIRDQAHCGSCWAFGAAEAFSDRLAIHSEGAVKVMLSPEDLVSCAPFPDMGCNGGIPYFAWHHMKAVGVVSDSCFPYTAGDGNAPKCAKTCEDGTDFVRHKLSKFYKVSGEQNIMAELATNGPLEGAFSVYEDFMTYKSGVYTHTTGKMLGGHAIKILGWGVENGVKYWLCANSWTSSWGEKGFFKIRRGTNEVGIEATVYGGIPAEDHFTATLNTNTVSEVLQGLALGFFATEVPDLQSCLQDPIQIVTDLKAVFEDLKKHTPASLADAVTQLKNAFTALQAAAEDCKLPEEELKRVVDVLKTLNTPKKVIAHLFDELKVHGKDIKEEAADALDQLKQKNYLAFGSDAGVVLAQLVGTPDENTLSIDKDSVLQVLQGLVFGFASLDIPDLKTCVEDPVTIVKDLKAAFEDIKKHTPTSLADAVKQLKGAVEAVQKAMTDCGVTEQELIRVWDLLKTLNSPAKVFSHLIEELKLHGNDIKEEATDALTKLKDQKYEEFGNDAGLILAQLVGIPNDNVALTMGSSAVTDVLHGFVEGFTGLDIPDFDKCVADPVAVVGDIKAVIEDLKQHTPSTLADIVKQLKDIAENVQKAANDCGLAKDEAVKLLQVIKTLNTPAKIFAHLKEEIALHGDDLKEEATDALDQFKEKHYEQFGDDAGTIVAMLIGLPENH